VLNRAQYPSDVITLVALWRLRYRLTLQDLTEMFLPPGIVSSHEAVRGWEVKLTPVLTSELRQRRHGKDGLTRHCWHVDETCLKVGGEWCYLYRAVDRGGGLKDTMLSEHRDMTAAKAFFRSAKSITGLVPHQVTTDVHGSYPRAIRSTLGKLVEHRTSAYKNNRLEQDHRGIKGRTRCMRGFKSFTSAERFCRSHDELRNLRPRIRHNQHVPANRRRVLHLRRATNVLAILAAGKAESVSRRATEALARALTEPARER
jgi:transposase-like protein